MRLRLIDYLKALQGMWKAIHKIVRHNITVSVFIQTDRHTDIISAFSLDVTLKHCRVGVFDTVFNRTVSIKVFNPADRLGLNRLTITIRQYRNKLAATIFFNR